VPFSPETAASGVQNTGFYHACWYRRQAQVPALSNGQRLILHFGAVDYSARVWVNGYEVAVHEGGYTPFSADITAYAAGGDRIEIAVCVHDDPSDLAKPRGKQDWQLHPHAIWYPRTTGIWQPVWMERVPASYLSYIRWTPTIERWEIGLEARLGGLRRDDLYLNARLSSGDKLMADDTYAVIAGEVHRRIALSDPGIDDYRNEWLWSPESPKLIDVTLTLRDGNGKVVDAVESYTAIRSIGVQGDKFVLNDRPYALRMVLDQGYWLESGLTAPDDDAYRRDVELAKQMGFNGVRKHQKIESPRYLYWADVLGLLVWEEMPSAYRFTKRSVSRLTREWTDTISRDVSHPCIVAWVPLNESWGVPDLPNSPTQRHYVQALYHLTKTLDSTRPVIGNDGWESVATDIVGIHDYDNDPLHLAIRYGIAEPPELFKRERPAGRLLLLDSEPRDQPIILTEFGGVAYSEDEAAWGYAKSADRDDLAKRYAELLRIIRSLRIFAGFCYTQFADTYQEANGLLFADRTPKIPMELIARATAGPQRVTDYQAEFDFRERLMQKQRQSSVSPEEDHQPIHDPR
jgi:hypothetical protein